MEKNNIQIKEVAVYHPDNVVTNDFYYKHFEKQGKDIRHFLEVMGRDERYIIDNDKENTLTMGIEAAERVLKQAELTGKDIDMILFSTQVPEKTLPTNAMYVHNAIGAHNRTMILDTNACCAGMTASIDTAARYMMTNDQLNTALVIGSDANSLIANPEQEITYANFADAAAAVILVKTEEENTGFIDSIYEVDSSNKDNIVYPPKGFSQSRGIEDYIDFLPFDGAMAIPVACEMIEELLERNGLTIHDVDSFCFSQFALSNIKKIQNHFDMNWEKIIYVGDKYGYTTTSSPLICLYEGIKSGQIKRGDTVLFWTIGAGHEMIAMLFKY
ncbi:3-oxoacyl-[acyl-carrier-protein] synthase-3 [Gracilibacillus ureilyticus]|uniref:3-oxoacyl-[acyl-carrier-protein] synthase-3 n=1 Tax=Gracilibacillus ureilyticus TaxID=531814 RepID=A0A1H9V7M5_9BACI|nr:3-oxoacyl-[acyl-carrier-protein] synthase III C-terminal domain-containing protein [Gracilibacillus ureilyticus]SES17850.1 3-oxoacyl-[acyl-carrier-protein] synthase-3 [Gracilibacillus ureilyticus]